jgi:glyoxylase-like metal-dependent hydrolase (beta-lactamase superfamily II)
VEIFAAVVGRGYRPYDHMFHLEHGPGPVELVFPFWLIRAQGSKPVLVDMGFGPENNQAKGVTDYRTPEDLLSRAGVRPEEIETIVISHLHWDHFNGPERYPNATFWIQDDDVRYFTDTGRSHKMVQATGNAQSLLVLPRLIDEGRVRVLRGGQTPVVPGVKTIHVGGHTPGMQIVVCERDRSNVVLACDASHFYGNFERRTPSSVYYRYDEFQDGLLAIENARGPNGTWFPGHDPAMLARMEPAGDGLYTVGAPS